MEFSGYLILLEIFHFLKKKQRRGQSIFLFYLFKNQYYKNFFFLTHINRFEFKRLSKKI